MKIWFDILTPKQLLFFEPMITRLKRKNRILCTSRYYREATGLAKIRKSRIKMVGRHGGAEKSCKLNASLSRMTQLSKIIEKFKPDLTISFCSPEASRISFGLGIKHVAFSNHPHTEKVMRLTLPLIQKLLIPKHIAKKEYTKFGFPKNDIIQYNAMDEFVIIKNKAKYSTIKNLKLEKKKTILFRTYETQAAYVEGIVKIDTHSIIRNVVKEFPNCNIIALGRYSDQIKTLKKEFGKKIIIFNKVVDSAEILSISDVFVGSGGTMTSEAALRGIPTISYNAVPNLDEEYLVKKGVVKRGRAPKKIVKMIRRLLKSDKELFKKKAKTMINSMEDPYWKLDSVIRTITE